MKTTPIRLFLVAAMLSGLGTAAQASCSQYGKVRSERSDEKLMVDLVNETSGPVRLYWIDYDGKLQPRGDIGPGAWMGQKSYASHPFIMLDDKNVCRGLGVVGADTQEIVAR